MNIKNAIIQAWRAFCKVWFGEIDEYDRAKFNIVITNELIGKIEFQAEFQAANPYGSRGYSLPVFLFQEGIALPNWPSPSATRNCSSVLLDRIVYFNGCWLVQGLESPVDEPGKARRVQEAASIKRI